MALIAASDSLSLLASLHAASRRRVEASCCRTLSASRSRLGRAPSDKPSSESKGRPTSGQRDIDATNLLPRAFPRLSAVAERLWSAMTLNNATLAAPRLVKQRCRMLERGIDVTPLGPGYCGAPEAS